MTSSMSSLAESKSNESSYPPHRAELVGENADKVYDVIAQVSDDFEYAIPAEWFVKQTGLTA
eukprot:6382169-Karenia_brevis.AAC.1